MRDDYQIRIIEPDGLAQALELVWAVFIEFEGPDYCEEGIRSFRDFIVLPTVRDKQAQGELTLWGCYDGERVAGVIAMRPPCHISLLFVDKHYHRQGIARALFAAVLAQYPPPAGVTEMTVNSSPYAQEFYPRLGFTPTAGEQVENGIRFIPMRYVLGCRR